MFSIVVSSTGLFHFHRIYISGLFWFTALQRQISKFLDEYPRSTIVVNTVYNRYVLIWKLCVDKQTWQFDGLEFQNNSSHFHVKMFIDINVPFKQILKISKKLIKIAPFIELVVNTHDNVAINDFIRGLLIQAYNNI